MVLLSRLILSIGMIACGAFTVGGYAVYATQRPGFGDIVPKTCFAPGESAGSAKGRVFHVDSRRGSDKGDGSAARPWRSLTHLAQSGLIGEETRAPRLVDRAIARIRGGSINQPLHANGSALVRGGDTILLASGDYGNLRLSGLANRTPITIATAPGARARFESIAVHDLVNFVFRDLIVAPEARPQADYLVTTRPAPDARRSYNLRFVGLTIDGAGSIAQSDPVDWAKRSTNGIMLFGECIDLSGSTVRDSHIAVAVYRSHRIKVESNDIHGFSVDGIEFSGNDIVIRNNVISEHWPTGDSLHPDCMQGQSTPNLPTFGPVQITGNVCLSDTSGLNSRDLQGINIFDGRWNDVHISCNFVRPTAAHGIALYGVHNARVENNVVMGWPGLKLPWIAALPSKEGRVPTENVITGNSAVAYLNAVNGGVRPPQILLVEMRVDRNDTVIGDAVKRPAPGVALYDNVLLKPGPDMTGDKRFRPQSGRQAAGPLSVEQARAILAESCPGRAPIPRASRSMFRLSPSPQPGSAPTAIPG